MLGRDEVGLMGVSPGVLGGEVGKGETVLGLGAYHPGGDARAKLKHLAWDIPEESARRPATSNEHDSKNRDSGKVHGHRGAGADGVGAHVIGREAKKVFTDV
jgi:hypothetical protein